jgi:hypothetical protein
LFGLGGKVAAGAAEPPNKAAAAAAAVVAGSESIRLLPLGFANDGKAKRLLFDDIGCGGG